MSDHLKEMTLSLTHQKASLTQTDSGPKSSADLVYRLDLKLLAKRDIS
ncbi:hypothetical protein [Streptococcus equi]|nr:hypothetical protein [Streptococcus equi]MCD3426687.1 hypothetical protein [Streptococcus equi subsp. zooepidemicus]